MCVPCRGKNRNKCTHMTFCSEMAVRRCEQAYLSCVRAYYASDAHYVSGCVRDIVYRGGFEVKYTSRSGNLCCVGSKWEGDTLVRGGVRYPTRGVVRGVELMYWDSKYWLIQRLPGRGKTGYISVIFYTAGPYPKVAPLAPRSHP